MINTDNPKFWNEIPTLEIQVAWSYEYVISISHSENTDKSTAPIGNKGTRPHFSIHNITKMKDTFLINK